MDHKPVSMFVSSAHNANMAVICIKHKISWLRSAPGDFSAIIVLHDGSATITDQIGTVGGIVKIHGID